MLRVCSIFCLLALMALACFPERQPAPPKLPGLAPYLQGNRAEVEHTIRNMKLDEKLGQLILLARDSEPEPGVYPWVQKGAVGGLQLSGLAVRQFLRLRDSLQQAAPFPLLMAAPSGMLLHNQFSDAIKMPSLDAINALPSDSLKAQIFRSLLEQARQLNLNYLPAPVLAPWEQFNYELDTRRAVEQITLLNEARILSMGDAFAAVQVLAPENNAARDSLLGAYKHLINAGLAGFHLHASLFEDMVLPPKAIETFFRGTLKFDGLLAARLEHKNQVDEILDSGVDLIITPGNPEFVLNYLKAAYRTGELSEQSLHEKLRRILLAKQWVGQLPDSRKKESHTLRTLPASLNSQPAEENAPEIPDSSISSYFSDQRWHYWQRRILEESLVVAANPDSLLPFRQLESRSFRLIHLGENGKEFDEAFGKYAPFLSRTAENWEDAKKEWRQYSSGEVAVLALHDFALDSLQAAELKSLARQLPLVLANLGQPGNLYLLDTSLVVVQAFSAEPDIQALAPQLLFGGVPAAGKLPYSFNAYFRRGKGMALPQIRMRYGLPQQQGLSPEKLVGIDAIVRSAIDEKSFPGCQVLLAKNGTVVYNKVFGNHTYDSAQAVRHTTLYDLASLTKVAATTLSAMKLYEEGRLELDTRLRNLMPMSRNSRLRNLTVEKLMAHRSGLQPHMPVLPYLLYRDMNNNDCSRYFCSLPSDTFPIEVAKNFYFSRPHFDKIWLDIHKLRVRNRRFRYSDVNFILLQQLLEQETEMPLDAYAEQHFYRPLGLQHTLFRPISRFEQSQIAPTQNDRRWRHQLVHGYVHDETAALLGGVAGHAGLFSTAEELAVIFQLLLNEGQYGGAPYFQPETVRYFTSARHGNHRGLGFDKPREEDIDENKFPKQAGEQLFGHTGFTGTCAWADPDTGLLYIFLSNRIYPDSNNKKLFQNRVRERIHQVAYEALDTYHPSMPELSSVH